MFRTLRRREVLLAPALLALNSLAPAQSSTSRGGATRERLRYWNQVAIDASGLDHTPVAAGEDRVFGEQLGPTRASRAMAIVHIAIFDAVNAVVGRYRAYSRLPLPPGGTSIDAAIATAAHDTLAALFPSQAPNLREILEADLHHVAGGRARMNGIALGRMAAAAILESREGDGSKLPEPRLGFEFVTR